MRLWLVDAANSPRGLREASPLATDHRFAVCGQVHFIAFPFTS